MLLLHMGIRKHRRNQYLLELLVPSAIIGNVNLAAAYNEMHVNNALYFVFPGMEQEMLLWDWKGVQDLC